MWINKALEETPEKYQNYSNNVDFDETVDLDDDRTQEEKDDRGDPQGERSHGEKYKEIEEQARNIERKLRRSI